MRRTKVGLVAGGLGAYWPQFPDLLPQLRRSAERVSGRIRAMDCDLTDAGFISDAEDGAKAAELLRTAGCDLIVCFLTTYMTASMLVPVAQRAGAPVLLINLQPTEAMDHDTFDTGQWLAYCGACPLPEMANAFTRCGVPFRSVSGYLEDERAWKKITRWIKAAGVRGALRHGRHGLMGHLYPGMLDVSTDLTLVTANFGGHVEVLEFDDLRVRVNAVTSEQEEDRVVMRARLQRRQCVIQVRDEGAVAPGVEGVAVAGDVAGEPVHLGLHIRHQRRHLETMFLGEVEDQLGEAARGGDDAEAASGGATLALTGGEHLGEFGEISDLDRAVGAQHVGEDGAVTGLAGGVRCDGVPGTRGAADLQRDHRLVPGGGMIERRREALR